jgi:hypothetical protein
MDDKRWAKQHEQQPDENGGRNRFFGFESVTMVPFESDLILTDMMTSKQVSISSFSFQNTVRHHLVITHHLFPFSISFIFVSFHQPN